MPVSRRRFLGLTASTAAAAATGLITPLPARAAGAFVLRGSGAHLNPPRLDDQIAGTFTADSTFGAGAFFATGPSPVDLDFRVVFARGTMEGTIQMVSQGCGEAYIAGRGEVVGGTGIFERARGVFSLEVTHPLPMEQPVTIPGATPFHLVITGEIS